MLLEAAACESFAAVRALPTFAAFAASFAVPPGLMQREDLRALTGYLTSVARGASHAAARAAAEARRAAAIAENARWLAHSDHRPIRVTAAATTAASAPVGAGALA